MEARSPRKPLKYDLESSVFSQSPCSSCSGLQCGRDASPNLLDIVSGSEGLTRSLSISAAGPLPMFRFPSPGDTQRALSLASTAATHMGAAVGIALPADRPWRYDFAPAMPRSPRPTRAQWYAPPAAAVGLVAPQLPAAEHPISAVLDHSVCSETSAATVDDALCGLAGFAAVGDVEDDACSAGSMLWTT